MSLTGMLTRGQPAVKTPARRRPPFRALGWIATAVWMAAIFYLSHQRSDELVRHSEGVSVAMHVLLYTGLAASLFLALRGKPAKRYGPPAWVPAFLTFSITVLFGVTDELHQTIVAGRIASETDVAFDAVGAAVGVGFALAIEEVVREWRIAIGARR